jgi:hypothetical protein
MIRTSNPSHSDCSRVTPHSGVILPVGRARSTLRCGFQMRARSPVVENCAFASTWMIRRLFGQVKFSCTVCAFIGHVDWENFQSYLRRETCDVPERLIAALTCGKETSTKIGHKLGDFGYRRAVGRLRASTPDGNRFTSSANGRDACSRDTVFEVKREIPGRSVTLVTPSLFSMQEVSDDAP